MADRFVHLLKLGMGRFPAVDATVPFSVLVEALKFFYEKDEAIANITSGGVNINTDSGALNAIYIADLLDQADCLKLLLVRGDPARGYPGFVNLKTRKITIVGASEPDVVRASSCHIVISKQQIASGSDQGQYRMVMEQSPGIGRVLARDFIGKLLSEFSDLYPERFVATRKRIKKGDLPEQIRYRPTVRFNPQENARLQEDLKSGRIGGFKLVRGKYNFKGEAEAPQIQKLDVQLQARIAPTEDYSKVRALVDALQEAFDLVDFQKLKLNLVDDVGSDIPLPGYIDLKEEEEADMRYCKKVQIVGLPDVLHECYSEMQEQVVDFATKVLSDQNHWVP